MTNAELTNRFENEGYVKLKNSIAATDLSDFQSAFYQLLCRVAREEKLDVPSTKDSKQEPEKCNTLLQRVYRHCPHRLMDIQRLASRLPEFYRISSNKKISDLAKALLGKEDDCPLYVISNIVVFDFPKSADTTEVSSNFHIDWHDDKFWTIPESRFIHIWIPLLNSVTEAIGPLEICEGSHKDFHNRQYIFNADGGYNYRYGIDESTISRYPKKSLEVDLGEMLLFDGKLIHRSGDNNTTDRVRMTMIGLFHDASNSKCIPGTPSFKYRGKTPEQWFYELYQVQEIKPFLKEQLDESSAPPTGI